MTKKASLAPLSSSKGGCFVHVSTPIDPLIQTSGQTQSLEVVWDRL